MKKVLFALLTLLVLAGCSSKKKTPEAPTLVTTQKANDLPPILLTKLDGKKFFAKDLQGHSVILILFQSDCDHCQREAGQIKTHIDAFRNYQLYFISADAVAETSTFAANYKLAEEPNVTFTITDVSSVLNNFGPIPTPSIYIYNADGKMTAKFNGETDINLILKQL